MKTQAMLPPAMRALQVVALVLLLAAHRQQVANAAAAASRESNWDFPLSVSTGELERERDGSAHFYQQQQQQQQLFRSPALIGRQLGDWRANLLSRNNGRLPEDASARAQMRQSDQFQCVEPTRALYDEFKRQYNRTFRSAREELERTQWFKVTLKRAIQFNRFVQDEIFNNLSNLYVRNFHFIEPMYGDTNLALWYADITDCELGLLKYNLFRVFNFIDDNQVHLAYEILRDQSEHLPALASSEGLEQVVEILLVRLFDRMHADARMDQLFKWPLYMKKLATYAYSQQQAQQSDFKTKLALVSFAHPSFFKDVKYNARAINRTQDNLNANREHTAFNKLLGRKFKDLHERNRRLVLLRQRLSLVDQLNGEPSETNASASNRHLLPEWLRAVHSSSTSLLDADQGNLGDQGDQGDVRYEINGGGGGGGGGAVSEKLVRTDERLGEGTLAAQWEGSQAGPRRPFRLTQFSDLTDAELRALLSDDMSLLEGNENSQQYLRANFRVRKLDARFRWDVAHELELRAGIQLTNNNLELLRRSGQLFVGPDEAQQQQQPQQQQQESPNLLLAKQVVDELVSDAGLPLGPSVEENIGEEEHMRAFEQVANYWQKPYMVRSSPNLADERAARYQRFKDNHGRFRAWFAKSGEPLTDARSTARLLRLADMSWSEIKLALFKVCCATESNLLDLSATSATLQYLASNQRLLCGQLWPQVAPGPGERTPTAREPSVAATLRQQQQQQPPQAAVQATTAAGAAAAAADEEAERNAKELYLNYLVHFGKHHLSSAEFRRRLGIFRRNLEAIRRHSCKRSLALFAGLKSNDTRLLNTMDEMDPRRMHTDDINLDRFEYFVLPLAPGRPSQRDLVAPPARYTAAGELAQPGARSRAAFSYRRDFLAPLLAADRPALFGDVVSASARLLNSWQDANESALKYRENNIGSVYDLVANRYRLCMKTTQGVEPPADATVELQCKTDGLLGDKSAQMGGAVHLDYQLQEPGQRQRDACAFYFQGLDAWAEGLIPQSSYSIGSIIDAKC